MELVYLWLEDYINIKNCGFNFGNRVVIKEVINVADKTINLSVTENPSYIHHFFGTQIRNITGIVGGNGVGKSNLLDFLKSFLINKNYIDVKWLAVFFNQETEDFIIIHSLYVVNKSTKDNKTKFEDAWNVSLSNNTKFKFRDVQHAFHEHHFIEDAYGSPQILELNSSVIFYSPFLDFRDYPGGKWTTEYMDVSTNYLVYTDSEDAPRERDKLELHHFKNIERQFLFVQNNKKLVEELNLPSDLQVRFVKTDDINKDDLGFRIQAFYKKFRDFATSTWNIGPNAIIREGKEKRSKKILEEGLKWKLKMWFSINLVSNYLYNYAFLVDLHDEYFPGGVSLEDFNFENTDTIALAKQFFATLTFPNNRKFNFIEFIDYVNNVIDTKADVLSNRNDNECYFYVPPEIALEIWGRHHNYLSVFPNENRLRGFLELNWRDISSGEKSFLDLFSRLYSAISTLAVSEHLNSQVYILLDEGEAGFHPNWQKAYIAYLIRFFEQMKGLDFALIMATHSPFIVSDLPSENLILLDKNKDGFCVVKDTLDSVKKTFGANIHILLADSFFMQEGLIGSFAKGKIEEVIQWLQSTDRQNSIMIKRIINLIDEPLIKVKLTEMYAEKLGLNFEEERIREQIQQLNERLDELNKKNNNDSDT